MYISSPELSRSFHCNMECCMISWCSHLWYIRTNYVHTYQCHTNHRQISPKNVSAAVTKLASAMSTKNRGRVDVHSWLHSSGRSLSLLKRFLQFRIQSWSFGKPHVWIFCSCLGERREHSISTLFCSFYTMAEFQYYPDFPFSYAGSKELYVCTCPMK